MPGTSKPTQLGPGCAAVWFRGVQHGLLQVGLARRMIGRQPAVMTMAARVPRRPRSDMMLAPWGGCADHREVWRPRQAGQVTKGWLPATFHAWD